MGTKAKSKTTVLVAPGGGQKSKALRAAKRKAHYATQFARTETNRKRRMRRHLRAHPADQQNANLYERVLSFGPVALLGYCCKGKRRAARTGERT